MGLIFADHKVLATEHEVKTHIEIERVVKKTQEKETIWFCGQFAHTNKVEEARDLGNLTEEELLITLAEVVAKLGAGESAKIIQIATQTVTVELVPEEECFRESMRHSALSKLTQAECEALGVTALAVYDKVKFHGGQG